MPVTALHHCTIRCTPDQLPALQDFYTRVLRLEPGPRPEIPAPGAWLYADGQPIVHLYAHLAQPDPALAPATGPLDHVAFRSHGLQAMRRHLQDLRVEFAEAPIPGWRMHQLFLHDPLGLKVELTFWLDTEEGGAT